MKFLCDRCKTRYSIGDDRVRGKILKIRCKNCANVITVREGMSADSPGDGAPEPTGRAKKPTTVAPVELAEDRASPLPKELSRRAAGAESPAREPAREPVAPAREPARPATRDTGKPARAASPVASPAAAKKPARPDDVPRAQGTAKRNPDALRSEPDNALGQAFASAMAKPAPAALEEEWYVSIDGEQAGPYSLADARRWVGDKPYDAELHCWREGFDDWLPVDKVSHFRGLRMRPAPVLPRSGPRPSVAPPDEPKPAYALGATTGSGASGGLQAPSGGLGRAAPAVVARGNGAARAPFAAPFDTSEDSDVGSELEATRYRDPHDPRRGTSGMGAMGTPSPSAAMAAVSPGSAFTGPNVPAAQGDAVVSAPASDFESDAHAAMGDDLHIGEVSRVVSLADLRPPTRHSRAPSVMQAAAYRAATNPGLAAAPGPAPLAASDPGASMAPVAKSHRRGLIVLLSVAGVMVLGVAAAVLLLVTTDGDTTGNSLGRVQNIDTSRPEGPVLVRPSAPGDPGPGSAKPTPSPSRPSAPRPSAPSAREPEPAGPALRSDEVEDIARKHQEQTQRCYMRAQRGADSILVGDVKKIAVTLTIDAVGNVTDLQLSDHAADNLGKCLIGSIKTWKFRPSAGGTFRFSLNFVSG